MNEVVNDVSQSKAVHDQKNNSTAKQSLQATAPIYQLVDIISNYDVRYAPIRVPAISQFQGILLNETW